MDYTLFPLSYIGFLCIITLCRILQRLCIIDLGKDKLHRIGGTTKFPITTEFLKVCSQAHVKYAAELAARREADRLESERKKRDEEMVEKNKSVAIQLSDLDKQIRSAIADKRSY